MVPNKKFIINILVSIFIALLIYGFIKLISPFIISIFFSIIFSIIYYPFYRKLIEKRIKETIASFITVILMVFTVILPFSVFFWLLFKEAKSIYPQLISYIDSNPFVFKLNLPQFIPLSSIDIKEIILANLDEIRKAITKSGIEIIRNIFLFFVNFFVMLVSMFFILKDGKRIILWLIDIIPFENRYIERILTQFALTTNAIIKGVILTAFVQGVVAIIGLYIINIPSPILFGAFVMIAALIPFVGTSIVTIPIAIYYYLNGDIYSGTFMLIWGMFVVGLVDNIVRPIFIGKNARIPIALVFLGIIGGIRTYGPPGIFIGPIFVSIIITILEIYKEDIKRKQV
jgi:predicted PurR-regulated permease PerM